MGPAYGQMPFSTFQFIASLLLPIELMCSAAMMTISGGRMKMANFK